MFDEEITITEKQELQLVKPVDVKIEYTYEYDKFKLIGINRNPDKKHIGDIAEAIQFRNLLHLFPLIVNTKFEVMDGQHRLGAVKYIEIAKLLKLPLYYIMDHGINLDDIHLLNSNKVNWKNLDYVNYYANREVESYMETKAFLVQFPMLSLSAAIILLSSERRDMKKIKAGLFKADRVEKAYYIMRCILEIKDCMGSQVHLWKSTNFISAFQSIVNTKKYQHHVMMSSSINKPGNWEPQKTKRAYVHEFNRIYNNDSQVVDFVHLLKREV